ncbi:MAG: chorismate mutase [bacterium]
MENLEELRNKIDEVDKEIFLLLKKRFEIVKKVGEYKKANNLPIRDLKREEDIIKRKVREIGMDKELVERMYRLVFEHSYRMQK